MKKLNLLVLCLLAATSFSALSAAVTPSETSYGKEAPPPPPPPPPPFPTEKQAANKAIKLAEMAQRVVKAHDAFKNAEVGALSDPTNPTKAALATAKAKDLASALDDLMRNTKSLENDLQKLLKADAFRQGESQSLSTEQSAISRQKLPSQRKQADLELLDELKKRLAKRNP